MDSANIHHERRVKCVGREFFNFSCCSSGGWGFSVCPSNSNFRFNQGCWKWLLEMKRRKKNGSFQIYCLPALGVGQGLILQPQFFQSKSFFSRSSKTKQNNKVISITAFLNQKEVNFKQTPNFKMKCSFEIFSSKYLLFHWYFLHFQTIKDNGPYQTNCS